MKHLGRRVALALCFLLATAFLGERVAAQSGGIDALGSAVGSALSVTGALSATGATNAGATSATNAGATGATNTGATDVTSTGDASTTGAVGETAGESGRLSTALEIAVLLTVLSLLPAILITVTSFTRIVIVLSFVRRSLTVNELPPNPVIIGLALFLTTFVMAPIAERIHERAYVPYAAKELSAAAAGEIAWGELRTFLVANTRASELALFADISAAGREGEAELASDAPPPLRVVVPAFVLSELKTAFQMGFLLFLPFLVIDLVVSSVLLSMGMFMLPPVMISTPLKILLFVLVDGWHLVCQSLVTSFVTT